MGVGGDYERRIASEAKRVAKYSVTLTECNSLLQVFFIFMKSSWKIVFCLLYTQPGTD